MFERNAKVMLQKGVNKIPKSASVDYEAFLVGNDPVLSGLPQYEMQDNHFVLIATSCFRAVGIACRLANKQDKAITPNIVIIDSSRQVNEIWQRMQNLFSTCVSQAEFQQSLPALLQESAYLFRVVDHISSPHPAIRYPDQNIEKYFQNLFTQYGFDYVRSLILDAVILQQDWENKDVFVSLKNIFDEMGLNQIVAYPSNIVTSYLPQKSADTIQNILQNIDILKPALTIHTDLCPRHNKPEQAYFFTESDASTINQQLFPDGERLACSVRTMGRA